MGISLITTSGAHWNAAVDYDRYPTVPSSKTCFANIWSMMDDVYCTWLSFSFGLREIPYCTRTTVQAQAPCFDRYVPAAKIVRRWRCDPETTARSTVTLPITEAKVRE